MKKERLKSFLWGLKLAWRIDNKMLMFWGGISVILAIFPALILKSNREIIATLSTYLSTGCGSFEDISSSILLLGILIIISGLSVRLNDDFLYMTMYDSFYLGLEESMMEAAQRIDLTELVKKEVSDDFYAAISRCGSLTDLTSSGCAILGKVVSLISILIVAISVSPQICVLALVYIVFILWINTVMSEKVRIVWKEMREHLRKAEYYKKIVLQGDTSKEIRIFYNIKMIKEQWFKAKTLSDKMLFRKAKGVALINLLSNLGFYFFLLSVLLISLSYLKKGLIGPDDLLMIYSLGISIADVIITIPFSYQCLDYGLYGLGIQKKFFERTPAIDLYEDEKKADCPADVSICFQAENLSFSYPGGEPVLRDVTFTIKSGETVALVGLNGGGKTTLLKLMMGLYHPNSGSIKFMGRNYNEYKQGFLEKKIGAFFQDFVLFHMTVQENVGLGNIEHLDDEAMIWEALRKGGAANLVTSWNKVFTKCYRKMYIKMEELYLVERVKDLLYQEPI